MSITIKQNSSKPPIIPYSPKKTSIVANIDTYDVQTNPLILAQEIYKDAIFDTTMAAIFHKEGILRIYNSLSPLVENLSESIVNLSQDGIMKRISSGIAKIKITDKGISKLVTLNMQDNSPTVVRIFSTVVENTLMAHCISQIDSRLVNMTKEINIKLYASQNHTTDIFIRNQNCWLTRPDVLTPINLTSISPSNSLANGLRAGILITPRHVLNAAHYPLFNGNKIYFVTQDGNNTAIERTIISSVNHPNYAPYHPDLRLYTLNADLPSAISPCKTLPPNYSDYIFNTQYGTPPTFGLDQEEKALVTDLYKITSNVSHLIPKDSKRLEFYEDKIGGDSGNPSFLIVNNELVLLTCWTYGGAGSGTSIPYYLNDINNIMIPAADANAGISSTGYTLQTVDLSIFPVL